MSPESRHESLDVAPSANVPTTTSSHSAHPTFREAFRFWVKLGFISFGGPAGQIAIMQHELVEKKRWIGQARFLHALNFCMLLPGPEAQQLAIYCGWLLHRTWGGIAAGVLFVLPSVFILWGLSLLHVTYGNTGWVAAFFDGLQPAVTAVVAAAVPRLAAKALRTPVLWGVAAAAFVLIFGFDVAFPLIVAGAALAGWATRRFAPEWFPPARPHGHGKTLEAGTRSAIDDAAESEAVAPSRARAIRVVALCGALWAAPILAAGLFAGWGGTLVAQGRFFSQAAMVTFGGAYAVLPYVAEEAVETHGWLGAPDMLTGLAFAESTPGPLIMVLQFVGFMGGWTRPDSGMSPLLAATLGSAMTTWVTFVPCFLWIFLGAPHIERLRGNASLAAALSGVTAAVVGVVLNLAVWFAWQVWHPADGAGARVGWGGVDWFAVAISVTAFLALHRKKAGLVTVLVAGGAAGLLRGWLAGAW